MAATARKTRVMDISAKKANRPKARNAITHSHRSQIKTVVYIDTQPLIFPSPHQRLVL